MWLDKASSSLNRVTYPVSRVIHGIGVGMLAAMMFLTAADVCLRYIFNSPIRGANELTEFMMAVLIFFAIAYTAVHKRHVSIDIAISRLPSRARAVLDTITCSLSIGILGVIAWRSFAYALELRVAGAISGTLPIPIYPFLFVVAFGSALLCVVFLGDLLESISTVISKHRLGWLWLVLSGVLVALVFAVPLLWAKLPLDLSPMTVGLIGMGILMVLLFSGMVVGCAMALIGFLGMIMLLSTKAGITAIGMSPYTTSSSYGLSVFPLFVLMGGLCFFSGLSRDLYFTAYKWLGYLPGGLAMATVGACGAFAAVSGSSLATAATMGMVAIPEMKRYKYDTALATGCVAAGGTVGILIPPSVTLVLYGILTNQSIGELFFAGFIPGIMEVLLYIVVIYIMCKRNPLLGPRGPKTRFTEKVVSLKSTWGVLVLFGLVMGGLYAGVFTPTEAGGIGAFGAFIFAIGKRGLSWSNFKESLSDSGKIAAMGFLILIGAMILGYFLAASRLPFELASLVSELPVNRYIIMTVILLVYIALGCVMSVLALIILTVPIFFPLIVALGFDPIWFGVIIVRVVEMGQITPPVGINVYAIKGVAKDVPINTIFRGIVPFLMADIFQVVLLVAFPEIALFLPSLLV